MDADSDKYLTFSGYSEGIYKEKGSRFLAFAWPVTTEDEVRQHIKDLKKTYFDARHHVYAFRLGADMKTYRCSDDGEPANSSGPPVFPGFMVSAFLYASRTDSNLLFLSIGSLRWTRAVVMTI